MVLNYIFVFLILFFVLLFVIFLRLKKPSTEDLSLSSAPKFEIMEIQVSKNEETPTDPHFASLLAENMFSALHGLLKEDAALQEHFSFEIVSSGARGIRFYVVIPSHICKFVESQVYAQYPSAQIRIVEDYVRSVDKAESKYNIASVTLSRPVFFPVKSFRDFEIDPLSSVTSAMSSVLSGEEVWFQLLIKPIADNWQKEGFDYAAAVRDGTLKKGPSFGSGVGNMVKKELVEIGSGIITGMFTPPKSREELAKLQAKASQPPRISATQELELRAIENKLARMGFEVQIRVLSAGSSDERVETNLRSVLASLKQFSASTQNSFVPTLEGNKIFAYDNFVNRNFEASKVIILNTEELATIYHLPSSNIDTPNISWIYSRKSEPPTNLPVKDCTLIGQTMYRSEKVKFGIANNDDRLRHMYLIGKSGTGKSTLFETMISQDIANGAGVGVLDPHGDTIERVLERIPENRVQDIVYFDPSDTERPIGLNLLEMSDPSQKNLMASGLVAAIKQHFDYSWGPRLEYLLNYAILTLLEVPGTTMLGITRLMEDSNYQNYILHQIKDPLVIKFWEKEFKEMKGNQKLVTEAIAPIQNKVNRFLASTTIRNILGQKKSTLNIWDAMNTGKILLMNLSKGKIGSDNANLLGALLVSRIQFFALQRAKMPPEQRRPFYLYVDEFQNFASGSFEEILSESRKYKLGLYLTHQFTAQLPEQLLKAVFGNVGTIISFGLGAPDARELAKEFAPYFSEEDIISLERFQVYIKLMIDGMTSHPFSARILLPWEDGFVVPKTSNRDKVINYSRETYGTPHEFVEAKINKWLETKFDKGMAIAQEYRSKQATASPDSTPASQPTAADELTSGGLV